MTSVNCTTICRKPEVNPNSCDGCPGKGHEHCPVCHIDRTFLWECYGEPEWSDNFLLAMHIVSNCSPCYKWLVSKTHVIIVQTVRP